jgi:hypothetical protein
VTQLWAAPAKVYRACGYTDLQALYRDIRLKQFPFKYVKAGKRILISLRSIGMEISAKEETRDQVTVSQVAA